MPIKSLENTYFPTFIMQYNMVFFNVNDGDVIDIKNLQTMKFVICHNEVVNVNLLHMHI
jgi:hypothetical protein